MPLYDNRTGVLIIGQELKGVEEFVAEYAITAREPDVIRLPATGIHHRDIARRLNITERTVKSHLLSV